MPEDRAPQQQEADRQQQRTTRSQMTTLRGILDGYQRIDLEDAESQHLVRLRMQDGTTRVVNLGPGVDVTPADLRPGKRIVVQGREARMQGRPVLRAHRFKMSPARDRQQRQQQRQTATLRGTLDGYRRVELRGAESRHLFRLRMKDGTTRVVDLGPRADTSKLRPGTRIVVQGRKSMMRGKPVLLARRFKVAPESGQQQRQQQERPQQRQLATLTGRIADWTKKSLEGKPEHTFVKLELKDGTARTVDLGPRADLDVLDLERGDRISVRGRVGSIQGKRVLVARQFKVEGEPVGLEREAEQPAGPNRRWDKRRNAPAGDRRGPASGRKGSPGNGSASVHARSREPEGVRPDCAARAPAPADPTGAPGAEAIPRASARRRR